MCALRSSYCCTWLVILQAARAGFQVIPRHPVLLAQNARQGERERSMKTYILYGTEACPLCDLAEAVIAEVVPLLQGITVDKVDIADSDALFERYGIRIPVLRHPDGRELNWPFSPEQLEPFLQA